MRSLLHLHLSAVFLLLLVTRCDARERPSPPNPESNLLDCWECNPRQYNCFDQSIDLFPDKVKSEYSDHWNITYHGTYKILNNTHSNVTYLFYQCGTDPPANAEQDNHVVVPVPLQTGMAVTSTVQIPHAELLGRRTAMNTYIGNPMWISSPCLWEMLYDNMLNIIDPNDQFAIEEWTANNPDSIILGNPWSDKTQQSLVVVSESQEKNNKAVFEWHKVYASFFNLEKAGNKAFDMVETRYECIKNQAELNPNNERPKVIWAYYSTYAQGWDVADCPNYYCEFADHCNAEFLYSNEGSIELFGAKYMTTEEFFDFAKEADTWVYAGNDWDEVYTFNTVNRRKFRSLPAVSSRNVFDTQGNGPNDWFETRMAEPDIVLQDFCHMVGTITDDNYDSKWFRNVFYESIPVPSKCEGDVTDPLIPERQECTRDTVSPSPSMTPSTVSPSPSMTPSMMPSMTSNPSMTPSMMPTRTPQPSRCEKGPHQTVARRRRKLR